MEKHIYILISRTSTKFGSIIRKIAKQKYNHASIVLDDDFEHIYAFARKQHNAPLLGGLVRESLDRFTLRQDLSVPVMVFKIPVAQEQYNDIKEIIDEMLDNKKYVYNLFSVFLYPIFKGFTVKNAFSCIEFVSYILQYLGFLTDQPACKYCPDDLITELVDYIYKEDDIRECTTYNPVYNTYFDKWQFKIIPKSCVSVCRIIKHGFCRTPALENNNTFHIKQ